jgi:ubiquinone/menaquinone biosynthesis C-methylase UbiE
VVATGVDSSERVIARARTRFPTADFRVAFANTLPFADGELDAYLALRVYGHIVDPGPALEEARRVLRPAGRIVLADIENDLFAIDADDQVLVGTLKQAFRTSVAFPWIGRLRSLLQDAGFRHVSVEVQTLVFTNRAEIAPVLADRHGSVAG